MGARAGGTGHACPHGARPREQFMASEEREEVKSESTKGHVDPLWEGQGQRPPFTFPIPGPGEKSKAPLGSVTPACTRDVSAGVGASFPGLVPAQLNDVPQAKLQRKASVFWIIPDGDAPTPLSTS